jgi:hypothetical protein
MKRLIYQVCLGRQGQSKLYDKCIESVTEYAKKIDVDHFVQTSAVLKIKPDPFSSNRSTESWQKHGGFLPIYEKENAFDLLDQYDQIAIIDADIYIRPGSPNIFDEMPPNKAFGVVFEREMPITDQYKAKIRNYSHMQYANLHSNRTDFKPNELGFEFANMGMIVLNSKMFKPYLKGQDAKQFITRMEFKDFVDGVGAWKWSTDQTLLNFFVKKYDVPVEHLSHVWNGLFTANTNIKECHFIHFFLKDKLPEGGENIKELMTQI